MANCCCFNLRIITETNPTGFYKYPTKTGRTFDGTCVYTFEEFGEVWYIWRNDKGWYITRTLEDQPYTTDDVLAKVPLEFPDCPVNDNFTGTWEITTYWVNYFYVSSITSNEICCPTEERIFKEYKAIKLPVITVDEDRGAFRCCEPNMVLAHPTETDSYKNDVTSVWIKLSDITDTVTFTLKKDGIDTGLGIMPMAFPHEPNAYYSTIQWKQVLNDYGIGCYTIEVDYSIGGIVNSFTWGTYNLLPFTTQNALKTARIRVKFNLNQSIEGINFTDADVEDSIRFYGFIGNRQPNMEIDNLIYNDRTVKSVVRENLNTYEIKTDPYENDVISRLTDLYLLSENECFISDYNEFNHSYEIKDVPVIVEESPEIDYLEAYQRKAVLSCIVGDKSKNKRTFY